MLLLLPQTHTQTHTDTHTRTRTKHVREALSVHMWVFKEKNFQSFLTGPFLKMVAMVKM